MFNLSYLKNSLAIVLLVCVCASTASELDSIALDSTKTISIDQPAPSGIELDTSPLNPAEDIAPTQQPSLDIPLDVVQQKIEENKQNTGDLLLAEGQMPGIGGTLKADDVQLGLNTEENLKGNSVFTDKTYKQPPQHPSLLGWASHASLNTATEAAQTQRVTKSSTVSLYHERDAIFFLTHVFLALSGIYVLFYGFRAFRFTMVILSFYVSYYAMMLVIAHTSFFNPQKVSHEIGILLIALGSGLLLCLLTSMLEMANYFVFGSAVGLLNAVFYSQFFLDFSTPSDKLIVLGIYGIVTLVTVLMGRAYMQQTITASCASIGSMVLTINVGILTQDFPCFEERDRLPPESLDDFINYSSAATVLFIAGLFVQYFLRERIIQDFTDRKLKEIRGVSFLE